jgi:hypothetical protein
VAFKLGVVVLLGWAGGLTAPRLAGAGPDQELRGAERDLIAKWTNPTAELREKVPIANGPRGRMRSVLSLPLPRMRNGDRIKFNGEVTVSTTCVSPGTHCIGRPYRFSPHLHARIVIGQRARAAGRKTQAVSRTIKLTCSQVPPDRNHHCPMVFSRDSITVKRRRRLPCRPGDCRLNMLVAAHHRRARSGDVVVIGADRPGGRVDNDKARMSAAILRDGARIAVRRRSTRRRLTRLLPASFDGGGRIVYSQRLPSLHRGDVLLIRTRQRTRIERFPYFIGTKILISTRPRARSPTPLTRRIVSRGGLATERSGFNCTIGPSHFRSPCLTRKAGLALIRRTPMRPGGRPRPLFVNVLSRGFPKVKPTSADYPPLRVIRGGGLTVTRLRASSRRRPRSR